MKRVLSALVVLPIMISLGCNDSAPDDGASPKEAEAKVGAKTPPPTAPKTVERPPEIQDDCRNMYGLLVKCSGNQRLRADGHFKRLFLNNCRREVGRDTTYAKRFAECAGSKDCGALDVCSKALEKAAGELGPEHVKVILTEGRREEAKKFCHDNSKAVAASEALHDVCHGLLEEVEADKEAAKDGGCPLHDHH